MSGGQLVLLHGKREVKRFPLTDGLATLGRDPSNDIRITLSSVAPHHASVVLRDGKPLVRSQGGRTLVNGRAVSVAALRHGDVISIADRALRWETDQPQHSAHMPSPASALSAGVRRARPRPPARRSEPAPPAPRDRALQLAIEMSHRASISGSTGSSGKQVAIVQPQRRNASEHAEKSPARSSPQTTSRRNPQQEASTSLNEEDKSKRKSPKSFLQNTTKATLWIEQRKTSPRRKSAAGGAGAARAPAAGARRSLPHGKATPLRLTVLRKAQSAHKPRIVKIQPPLKIDHTKQAAIMLMTGHTLKSKLSITPTNNSNKKSPSYVVKKPSPFRKTPRGKGRQSGRGSKDIGQSIGVTPSRGSTFAQESANRRSSKRNSTATNPSVSILEISDSTRNSSIRGSNISTRSNKTPKKSPALPSPKKSAMKDHSKKSVRKTESIKFDLSNLVGYNDREVFSVTDTTQNSDEDITLHYSESSNQSQSPSPRRSIHSRSSKMLERVGTTLTSLPGSPSRTLTSFPGSPSRTLTPKTPMTPDSPSARRSIRSSAMVQKALETSSDRTKTILSPNSSEVSDRTRTILSNTTLSDRTKTIPSADTTTASAFRTRTLSPRSNHNLESYSVVDLVSFNSDDVSKSVYNSAGSETASEFGTPPTTGRRSRSTIGPNLGTSTPYVGSTRATRSKSSSNVTDQRISNVSSRRSKSLSTPENKHISVNSTRVSRASRSRSRINDSDLMLLDDTDDDTSPRTSRRSRSSKSKENTDVNVPTNTEGMSTPENRHSPEAAGTPVLSIQSLLNSSRSSIASNNSKRKFVNYKRKTIGGLSEPKRRADAKSKSLGAVVSSVRKTRLRLSHDSDRTDPDAAQPDNEDTVTPRSAVKPSPEAVKNKHSTAKKPQSKRSIIDDLNRSDIIKQLFNSPVKRKLSQSMTEFSRRQLFDDEDTTKVKRPTRRTIAVTGRTPDNSLLEATSITPERFVSPVDTPNNSPNLSSLKRLFGTPQSDSRKGGGDSPRPTRARPSKNDLTDVQGVKLVFAKSPRNDLRRVTGVRTIFQQTSPENDLTDVRGVRRMFQKASPENDLRNVSGVKRTIARTSPRNDLTDVRGVRRMFKQTKRAPSYHDVSGIEELYDTSTCSADRSEVLFDKLIGRPSVKAVYSKTFTTTAKKPRTRRRSLRTSVEITPSNVDQWIEEELKKRLPSTSANVTKELQKLATDTVEGSVPIRGSRTRNSSMKVPRSVSDTYHASTLPIKKRSLPLKKRAIHSTPVKGRVEVTMNASELGRVSPIAVVHLTRDIELEQDGFVSRSTQTISEDTTMAKTRTPRKQETPKKIEIAKTTPEKSPEKPAQKRATRNKKVAEISQSNIKKRRSSLVVSKKAPVMSPKAKTADKTPNQSPKAETRRTRATRVSIVVPKHSPKMKPQPAAKTTRPKKQAASPKATRTRKVTIKEPESPKQSPQKKRSTRAKASEIQPKASTSKVGVVTTTAKRGRNTVVLPEEPQQTKRTRKTKTSESSVAESSRNTTVNKTRRGKVITPPKAEEKLPKGRGKKAQNETQTQPEVARPGRDRKAQNQTSVEEKRPNNRSRRAENQSAEPEPARTNRRGNRTDLSVETVTEQKQVRGRGKKTQVVEPAVEETQPKGRGRKGQNQTIPAVVEEPQRNRRRAQNQTVKPVEVENQTRRGKKAQLTQSEPDVKATNAKKTTAVKKVEIQQSETTTRRGKKAEAEEKQPKTRGNKAQSPIREPRSRRANTTAAVESTGRKRKALPSVEVPTKVAKTEAKKAEKASSGKQNKESGDSKTGSSKAKTKATKADTVVVTEPKQTRGRKAEAAKEVSTGRGKRKANVEHSPANVATKKSAKESKASRAPAPTRNARGKQPEVTTTRSRRR